MKNIVLLGGGGHAKVIISVIKELGEFNIVGIADKKEKIGDTVLDIPILYEDRELQKLHDRGIEYAFVTVGSIGNPVVRVKLFNVIKGIGFKIPKIISKYAIIKEHVEIGEGTVIMPGVIVNPESKIGKNCIINTGAIIEHDCIIGDHVHIAPGVTLSGNVKIGSGSHIGTGASVIQGIEVGENVIIGAGAVVVSDLRSKVIAYGIPAKERSQVNV